MNFPLGSASDTQACRADQGSAFLRERRFFQGSVYRDPMIAAIPPITL
jgi:hypothetical protein